MAALRNSDALHPAGAPSINWSVVRSDKPKENVHATQLSARHLLACWTGSRAAHRPRDLGQAPDRYKRPKPEVRRRTVTVGSFPQVGEQASQQKAVRLDVAQPRIDLRAHAGGNGHHRRERACGVVGREPRDDSTAELRTCFDVN